MATTEKIISYIQNNPRVLKKLGYKVEAIFPFVDLEKGLLLENHFLYVIKKEEKTWIFEQLNNETQTVTEKRLNEIQDELYLKRRFLSNYKSLSNSLKSLEGIFYSKETHDSKIDNKLFLDETVKNIKAFNEAKTYPKSQIKTNPEGEALVKWLKEKKLKQIASVEVKTGFNHEHFRMLEKDSEIKIVVKQQSITGKIALFEIKFEEFDNFLNTYNQEDKEKLIPVKAHIEKALFEKELSNIKINQPTKVNKI